MTLDLAIDLAPFADVFDVSVSELKTFICLLALSFAFGIGVGLVLALQRRVSPVERMVADPFAWPIGDIPNAAIVPDKILAERRNAI